MVHIVEILFHRASCQRVRLWSVRNVFSLKKLFAVKIVLEHKKIIFPVWRHRAHSLRQKSAILYTKLESYLIESTKSLVCIFYCSDIISGQSVRITLESNAIGTTLYYKGFEAYYRQTRKPSSERCMLISFVIFYFQFWQFAPFPVRVEVINCNIWTSFSSDRKLNTKPTKLDA